MTKRAKQPKPSHQPQHGEGSFYWRAKDDRWVGTLEAGWTPKGSRRRIVVTDKDEDRAWDKLQAKAKQIELDGLQAALQKDITVAAWVKEWLKIQAGRLRPKTYSGHASYMRRWVVATIGQRKISDLTVADVRAVTNAALNAGRSTTTAGNMQGVFQKCLRDARLEGYAVQAALLDVPKPEKNTNHGRAAIPTSDAKKLIKTAMQHKDGSRWVAALLQGIRQGERLGLLREDIDFDKKTISIRWQLQELARDPATKKYRVPSNYIAEQLEGRWHLVAPKSESSERVIPLLPWFEKALEAWLEASPPSPHGLVWPGPKGTLITPEQDRADWYALQDAAGVVKTYRRGQSGPPRFVLHEARHTTATLLLEAGVDPEVIKSIMGHSDIVTTAGYQHVTQELMAEALSRVGSALALEG